MSMLVIHETAFEPLYQEVLRIVEAVAQVYLVNGGPDPEVEFSLNFAINVEWDVDQWYTPCWLATADDPRAKPFKFYYCFMSRLEYISSHGKMDFWIQLRAELKDWLKSIVVIVDKLDNEVSLDRADFLIRSAKP
jgi:hypothetical protein